MSTANITLEIESDVANVASVGMCVSRLGESFGFAPQHCFELELAIVEAVTNSVEHAYEEQRGLVRIRLAWDEAQSELTIAIEDQGQPIPDQWLPKSGRYRFQEEGGFEEGGRGLFLMNQLTDELEISSDGGTNRVRMVKRLPQPAQTASA